jgi:hypothetical protein
VGAVLLLIALAFTVVPSIAAGGLLHPIRVALYSRAPQDVSIEHSPATG